MGYMGNSNGCYGPSQRKYYSVEQNNSRQYSFKRKIAKKNALRRYRNIEGKKHASLDNYKKNIM